LAGLADVVAFYDVRGVPINDENYAVIQRLAFWQTALLMAGAHPWLGVGLGNFAAAYPPFALLNWPLAIGHAHNIYLNLLAETGVFGLTAYTALWVAAAWLAVAALRWNVGWRRGVALGLLGAWAHLAVHHLVDYLYVNNIHLSVGAMLGLLAFVTVRPALASEKGLGRAEASS
jgi:O-antigen ligase